MAIKLMPAIIFLIGFLCLAASTHARSVSAFGDVTIDISEEKFLCDKIECPLNAERCLVTKEKDPKDPAVVVRTNICYSATNVELKKSVTTQAVDPNSKIKVFIEGTRSGRISTYNSYDSSSFNSEEFRKEFNEEMSQFRENLNKEMENLHKEMEQMNYELAHMFD